MVFVILDMVWPDDGILNAETGCHIIFYYFTFNNKTCWSLDGSFYYHMYISANGMINLKTFFLCDVLPRSCGMAFWAHPV
jgi:hypothetical protein